MHTKLIQKLHDIFRALKNPTAGQAAAPPVTGKFSPQAIYQTYDFSVDDIMRLLADILKPVRPFVKKISLDISTQEQTINAKVELDSFLRFFNFSTKTRLVDVWHDVWTSTAVCEFLDIKVHFISVVPKKMQHWCGKKLISLISFWGTFLQKSGQAKFAHFYLQEQFLYIDFRPWILSYINGDTESAANHWLSELFDKDNPKRGKKYLRTHVIFGAEIIGEVPMLRLYLYHIPPVFHKDATPETETAEYKTTMANWLEWLFATTASFLLVSFLVPFGLAYVKLAPFESANLFTLPFIFLYNTLIVLIPFFIFRIVLMPMRRLWASRHGQIEVLQAEVSRDQVFMPLLREWIILLQTSGDIPLPHRLLRKISSFLVKIGVQKYRLVDKISLIENRRRMYANIITVSYIGVCLLEALYLTGALPTPQFLANGINRLLTFIFLR